MDTYAGYDYTSSYYDTAAATGGFIGVILGMIGVILLIALVIYIIGAIGQWKVLKKAGEPGWGALIPIYNIYMLCKISGVNPWWILIVVLSPVLNVIPIIGSIAVSAVSIYFSILLYVSLAHSFGKDTGWVVGLCLLNPFFMLALGIGESKYLGPKPMNDIIFNKKNNDSNNNQNVSQTNDVGNSQMQNNTIIPEVNNQVQSNNEVTQDVNSNMNQYENNATSNVGTTAETLEPQVVDKYCSSCGTKVSTDSKFCPNCGRQL